MRNRSNRRYVNGINVEYGYRNLDTLGYYRFLTNLKEMEFLNVTRIYYCKPRMDLFEGLVLLWNNQSFLDFYTYLNEFIRSTFIKSMTQIHLTLQNLQMLVLVFIKVIQKVGGILKVQLVWQVVVLLIEMSHLIRRLIMCEQEVLAIIKCQQILLYFQFW